MGAAWGVRALVQIAPTTLPRTEDVSINYVVLSFSLGMTLLLTAGLGIFSALRASANARDAIHQATKRQEGSVGANILGRLLVVGQIAVTLALLAGAGLLGRSLLQVLSVDPGFHTAQVITMNLALPDVFEVSAKAPRVHFLSELMTRLRQIPGVEEVGGSSSLPLAAGFSADGAYAVLDPQQLSAQRQDLIRRSSEESLDSEIGR